MKYKSELIHEIVEQRGHEFPDLHYQSECIDTWIEETKGAYPKLCDYESEWLNYINENPIGEFPYETVTTNTTATVNNVVPYAYKSAILKGQTLVNLIDFNEIKRVEGEASYEDGVITYNANSKWTGITFNLPTVKNSTVYTVVIDVLENTLSSNEYQVLGCFTGVTNIFNKGFGIHKFTITSWDDVTSNMSIVWKLQNVVASGVFKFKLMLIEGDHTQEDIPYFTGMQSVKMPVLTTTGKNLFDENKKIAGYIAGNSINENLETDIKNTWTTYWIKAKPNTKYIISGGNRCRWQIKSISGVITYKETEIITTLSDTEYIRCYYCSRDYTASNVQIEEGSVATSYEPYKSNILTVNEDVTLRGIGDVQDTLDCLTGEVIERIGEVVLDGREDWKTHSFGYVLDSTPLNIKHITTATNQIATNFIADKLPVVSLDMLRVATIDCIAPSRNTYKEILICSETVGKSNLNEFKEWLSQNPITIQYQLATESIKTVDLTITNQDGDSLSKIKPIEGTMHIEVSGTPISPTAVLEVPVEAITQNLNSFIEG